MNDPVEAGVTDWDPLVDLLPLQAPVPEQLVALVVVQLSVVLAPCVRVDGDAAMEMAGAGVTATDETARIALRIVVPPSPVQDRV